MSEMISTDRLMAAIADAFRGQAACHCEGDGKLSEDELRLMLFTEGVVGQEHVPDARSKALALDGRIADRLLKHGHSWTLGNAGLKSLAELTTWRLCDLARLEHMSTNKAKQIERALAGFGLLMVDGDPALIEQARQEREDKRQAEQKKRDIPVTTPEGIRSVAAARLMEMSTQAMSNSAALAKFAYRVALAEKVVGRMKVYAGRSDAVFADDMSRLFADLFDLEANEAAQKKAAKKPVRRAAPVEHDHLQLVG